MKEIIINIVSNIIVAILTFIATKLYFGYKNFKGIKGAARLNKDCFTGGIINIFPNRKAYAQHKDHGTSSEYVLKADHDMIYVGYWLASGTELGNLKKSIKVLVSKKKTVTLVFMNPYNNQSLTICSKYIGVSAQSIKSRILQVLKDLIELKSTLHDNSRYLIIKVHDVPLATSAFLLDTNEITNCRILLDYKLYNGSREDSYGIEFENKEKDITNKVFKSYMSIEEGSTEIHSLADLHSTKV